MIPIQCRCGRAMEAQLRRFRSGRSRYTADCPDCGRLLRKSLPEKAIAVKVKRDEMKSVRIGSAFQWESSSGIEGSAAYHVDGMPADISANLIWEPELGSWRFIVHAQRQSVHGAWLSRSKEQALEDLKNWLAIRCTDSA